MICDEDFTSVEVLPLASLNNRGFKAVTLNPFHTSKLESADIQITNIFQDIVWYFPKLKNGHILSIPLESGNSPKCAFFVKEANKVCDLNVGDLIG